MAHESLTQDTSKTHPMNVECPYKHCSAPVGVPCQKKGGGEVKHAGMHYYHMGRKKSVEPAHCSHIDCVSNREKDKDAAMFKCWCGCTQHQTFVPNSTHKERYSEYQPPSNVLGQ